MIGSGLRGVEKDASGPEEDTFVSLSKESRKSSKLLDPEDFVLSEYLRVSFE